MHCAILMETVNVGAGLKPSGISDLASQLLRNGASRVIMLNTISYRGLTTKYTKNTKALLGICFVLFVYFVVYK